MLVLDGKGLRDKIAEGLKSEIDKLDQKPELVIFQVGDVAESNTYIGQKIKFGEKIGAIVTVKKLLEDVPQPELIKEIQLANDNKNVHGIIVQLPIPKELDKNKIIETIDPTKDVDGQTAANIKRLFEDNPQPGNTPGVDSDSPGVSFDGFIPATTRGVFTLLDHYKISVTGKHVVVVGRSTLVGKPTALEFLNRNATVTIAHSKTSHLSLITKSADILVVAAGKPKLITKDYVSKEQVVVDVGINVIDGKLIGDVDFENVKNIVSAISPVPGGAGPMTVASLFQNLLEAYKNQH